MDECTHRRQEIDDRTGVTVPGSKLRNDDIGRLRTIMWSERQSGHRKCLYQVLCHGQHLPAWNMHYYLSDLKIDCGTV